MQKSMIDIGSTMYIIYSLLKNQRFKFLFVEFVVLIIDYIQSAREKIFYSKKVFGVEENGTFCVTHGIMELGNFKLF